MWRVTSALAYAVSDHAKSRHGWWARTTRVRIARDPEFGHTFGHAIEAGLGYGHGCTVKRGCGMVMLQSVAPLG